ncbi:hypothetical protein H4R21_005624, partial [Coemansia helicoidea]
PRQPAAAAPRAVHAVEWQGYRERADPDQGQGQVHDRPHLDGRAVAQVPRPPGQHLQQHADRRDEQRERRGQQRAQPGDRRVWHRPGHRAVLQGGAHPVGRDRRRELRRGLLARARRHVRALPGRRRRHREELCAHPRDQPQEAGPAAADLQRPQGLRPHQPRGQALHPRPPHPGPRQAPDAPCRQALGRVHRHCRRPHLQREPDHLVPRRVCPEPHRQEQPL